MPTIMSAMRWMVELLFSFSKKPKPTTVNVPGHRHPVYAGDFTKSSPPYFIKFCLLCHTNKGTGYAYYCEKCDGGWHKECMPSSLGISEKAKLCGHPHRVYAGEFTKNSPPFFIQDCFSCHDNKDSVYAYYCKKCDGGWHRKCMPSSQWESEEVNLPGHHHPLLSERYSGYGKPCFGCGEEIRKSYTYNSYNCKICDEGWHRKCLATTSQMLHPFHPNHELKFLVDGAPDYTDGKCHFCREEVKTFAYHCSTCNFTLDLKCSNSPKPVRIDESKCHNHPLTLMARDVSFFCNVCGTHGERNPYVCLSCSFMVHQDCIDRPHVINVNRHDHRISHTYSLRPRNKICKVCRQNINRIYGAYSCTKCPSFVVHSKCATSPEVWDGEELKGVPNEEEETKMFKVYGENGINHQMHHFHNLRLTADGVVRDEGVRCRLCDGSVYSDKIYSCMECEYVLHETCAYLPQIKRLGFSALPFLFTMFTKDASREYGFFNCLACKQLSTGYLYTDAERRKRDLDLRCAAVDWSCDHGCHPHTLFLTNLKEDTCGACNKSRRYVLRCVDCKFNLCYECATYPKKIKHRCDDHPLVLRFGDKEQHGTYWCTVCEAKTDPRKWFYECEQCGIVCHIHCALGDFANVAPRLFTARYRYERGVVRNNGVTRPHCHHCATRCLAPFIYCIFEYYFCSYACLVPDFEFLENLKARKAKREPEELLALQRKIDGARSVQRMAIQFF